MSQKILMILTSHDKLGDSGRKAGYWEEEFAAPYYVFVDAGHEVTLASPKGGEPPCDPGSLADPYQTDATKRLHDDKDAQAKLKNTTVLSGITSGDYDAVFYPGGHAPMFDLRYDSDSIAVIESFTKAAKPIGSVCHGPAVLLDAKRPDGKPLLDGVPITGFSNTEEVTVQMEKLVPYSLQDEITKKGAKYEKGDDFAPKVVTACNIVTGQNPASSEGAARALLALLDA